MAEEKMKIKEEFFIEKQPVKNGKAGTFQTTITFFLQPPAIAKLSILNQ